MTTKAQQIMDLHKQGKTTRQIAEAVYGKQPDHAAWDRKQAYVRVVVRQREGFGRSEHDRKYMNNGGRDMQNSSRRDRYARDPAFREHRLEQHKRWKKANREHLLAYHRWYRANVRGKRAVAKAIESRHIG